MMRPLVLLLLGAAGCFAPKLPTDGSGYQCGMEEGSTLCPNGFECIANYCYKSGGGPFVGNHLSTSLDVDSGLVVFDVDSGVVSIDGMSRSDYQSGYVKLQPLGPPGIALWQFDSLHIGPGATVRQVGSRLLALAANSIAIEGKIQLLDSGPRGGGPVDANKPGDLSLVDGATFSQDGRGGGKGAIDPAGSGGGGGGHAKAGGGGQGPSGGQGGASFGSSDPADRPWEAGAGGGAGAGANSDGKQTLPGRGGSGGGAVALFAKEITIGATGLIDVSGGDGQMAGDSTAPAGGGGGGSGGSIIISATSLSSATGARLLAKGGEGQLGVEGGGKGGTGSEGKIWIGVAAVAGMPSTTPSYFDGGGPLATIP